MATKSKFDPENGFEARNRSEDAPKENSEEVRARHLRELDGARASLETVAGTFPHVGKGGPAAADLADAARNFARLADRADEEAKAREADAEKADAAAEKAEVAAEKADAKADAAEVEVEKAETK